MTVAESPEAFLRRAADHVGTYGPEWDRPDVADGLEGLLRSFSACGCEEDDDHWPQKSAALRLGGLILGEAYPPPAAEPEPVPDFTRRPSDVRAAVAANLTRLRRERGWTLQFVADKARVASNTVCSLERGTAGGGLFTVLAIASVYGVTLDELATVPDKAQHAGAVRS